MAARNFVESQVLERGVVTLHGRATGAGDANMTSVLGLGISSVNYASAAGKFTITLTDKWNAFLGLGWTIMDTNNTDSWSMNVVSEDVAGAKTIVVQFLLNDVETSPTSGEKFFFQPILMNSKQASEWT